MADEPQNTPIVDERTDNADRKSAVVPAMRSCISPRRRRQRPMFLPARPLATLVERRFRRHWH